MQSENANKPIAYTFFSGAGGLHLGLEQSGFDVILSTDIGIHQENTHKKNWPNCPFLRKDIRQLNAPELLKIAGGRRPNLIAGGPPCQGFSTLGDKLSSDPRNDLFSSYLRLAKDLEPEFILIENVKALTTMYGGRFSDWIKAKLLNLGYAVTCKVLNAADFGVPQIRNRAFFLGHRINGEYSFPLPTHGHNKSHKYENVGDWINDLINKDDKIPNHISLNHSNKVIERYNLIPEGGRLPPPEELPKHIRRKNFGNTYKRLHREKPSLTMVPGNNAFPIHPTLPRSLTPREAARLQSFPDEFIFTGDRRNQCILVGNAVPPLLAKAIGKSILDFANVHSWEIKKTNNCEKSTITKNIINLSTKKKKTNQDNFIDLFSGAGGFSIGFTKVGFNPLLCVDFNPNVAATHKENFSQIPFLEANLSDKEIQNKIISKYSNKDIGVIVGGPPCQGFSMFGKRRFVNTKNYNPASDKRNDLIFSYINIVSSLQPRWFVMENVPGFANLDSGRFLIKVIDCFKKIGYKNIEWQILNAAEYGVPQLRKRLVVIGNRTGHIIPWPKRKFFKDPEDWQKPFRTVGEVITDLSLKSSYENQTCHIPMKHKPLLVERYKYIEEGSRLDIDKLPKHLKKGYRTDKVKNYSHIFKRLHRNKPSLTMVPGHNAFPIHPWLNRSLTVREAARIQTFPDELEFKGSRQEQCIQVGNAFPPLLAESIANNIQKAEKNNWFPGEVPPSAYYSLIEDYQADKISLRDNPISA
tara:strand:+ start:874 stop:3129 length:2256 start_codon:yes stop_codon:yes gene_type:complete